MTLYSVLTDPLFLSFAQPIICGLVIQYFVHNWQTQKSKRQTKRAAAALVVELSNHSITIDSIKRNYSSFSPNDLHLFSTASWKSMNKDLSEISTQNFSLLCTYYSYIEGINEGMKHASPFSLNLNIEQICEMRSYSTKILNDIMRQ